VKLLFGDAAPRIPVLADADADADADRDLGLTIAPVLHDVANAKHISN
jgi:hypothetical protein